MILYDDMIAMDVVGQLRESVNSMSTMDRAVYYLSLSTATIPIFSWQQTNDSVVEAQQLTTPYERST